MDYHVVITAAGSGTRMGANRNKLFLEIGGIPMITHTLRVFEKDDWCVGISLVVKDEEARDFRELIENDHIQKVHTIVTGGSNRQESVSNGLDTLDGEGIVLIHDGARPLVNQSDVHRVAQAADHTGAALLAVPVTDTIKKVVNGKVVKTIDRESLWAAQTPQAFRLPLILAAHQKATPLGMVGTDDAALAETFGQAVTIVKGNYHNIKITTTEDLAIAENYLPNNQGGEKQNADRTRL